LRLIEPTARKPFPFQEIGEGRFEVHGLTEGLWRVRILVADQTVVTLDEVLLPATGPCM
jgi:hypothetical protein